MKKILITGISGLVGGVITGKLKDKYTITGVDRRKFNDVPTLQADCTNLERVLPAFNGIDVVIDLASDPNQYSEWDVIHETNLICTSTALQHQEYLV